MDSVVQDSWFMVLLTGVVAAAVRAGLSWLRANVTPKQLATVAALARTVVEGIEKLGVNEGFTAEEKYAAAEIALRDFATRLGLKLTDAELRALIEAAVSEYNAYHPHVEEPDAAMPIK